MKRKKNHTKKPRQTQSFLAVLLGKSYWKFRPTRNFLKLSFSATHFLCKCQLKHGDSTTAKQISAFTPPGSNSYVSKLVCFLHTFQMEWLKGRGKTGVCGIKASIHVPIFNMFLSCCPHLQPAQTEPRTQKVKN